jgi:hypothetical protein
MEKIEIVACELTKKEFTEKELEGLVEHIRETLFDDNETLQKVDFGIENGMLTTVVNTKANSNNPKSYIHDEFLFFCFDIREVDFEAKTLQRMSIQRRAIEIKELVE